MIAGGLTPFEILLDNTKYHYQMMDAKELFDQGLYRSAEIAVSAI